MGKTFIISIREKRAKNLSHMDYVCGNTDYMVQFDFDEEWDAYPIKTARFIEASGVHHDVTVIDNRCNFPKIMNTARVEVGVYAGDLYTTTPAVVGARRSILSSGNDRPAVPEDIKYDQMMEIINADAMRAEAAAVEAKESANEAKEAARNATAAASSAEKWANVEATAHQLEAGKQPTVAVTEKDGKKLIAFGIPKGDPGKDATVTAESISSALGYTPANAEEIPEWAKQPEKPTYTAQEVGALPKGTSIPSSTSDLNNDSGFITKAVADLTNYYTKSQTYTQEEINQRLSQIPKFSISVVSSLPASGDATTIYLVKSGSDADLYTEYIYVNGAWEVLGSQRVDLTGYATETWVIGQLEGYQLKGDYALKSEIPTVPTKVSQLDNDAGYLTEHQDISGKLDANKLPEAVNDALAKAKASGEFDGKDGYTPQKGVDYFDGKDGSDANVTAANITAALGYKPADAKTVSQLSEKIAEIGTQEEIVQQVIAALGTPVFGRVDAENNVVLTGSLADGEYIIKYEDADGNQTVIGKLTTTTAPTYTNILPSAINTDKTPFIGTNGEKGYKTGYRLNSSGAEAAVADWEVTGYIPIDVTKDVLYLKNIQFRGNSQKNDYIALCNSQFIVLTSTQIISVFVEQTLTNAGASPETYGITLDADNNVVSIDFKKLSTTAYGSVSVAGWANVKYIRFSCFGITADSIITKNEPI